MAGSKSVQMVTWVFAADALTGPLFAAAAPGEVVTLTTGHLLLGAMREHPAVAQELGVTTEAYEAAVLAVLEEAPEA
ncbi:MAG: hypothetical protein R3C39_05055 [Dehalococcoidia bacterium]